MSNKTRKGVRPALLAAALGVVAMLAVLAALALPYGPAYAQTPFDPQAPTGVNAAANSDGTEVTVTWTAGTGGAPIRGYEVERKVGSGSWESADPAHTGTAPSYTDSNVSDGMTYTYRVRATNNISLSGWVESNAIAVTVVDPNEAPVATGSISDLSLRINMTHGPIDVTGEFEDADGDDLTYSAASDNPNVADAVVPNGMLTVTAGSIRGTARITVTADDGNGGTASITFAVTVAEAYALTADPLRDPNAPSTYVVEEPGEYSAKFDLAVAGSTDDVTVTVTASEPADGGITIVDSDGLIGAGFKDADETDLEGSLTIKATDQGSRAFEIEGVCETPGAMATIVVEDKDLDEVAKGYILCEEPVVPPTPEERVAACYTISGMPDRGDDPATTDVVEGADIELLTTDKSVVLTVSSFEKAYKITTTGSDVEIEVEDCPDWPQTSVFIRLVDQPGAMPMVDDDEGFVDENGLINDHGQVVGVSSGGELMLDIMETVSAPAGSDDADFGVRRGKFRVFTPDDVEQGDRYFVELYDNLHSQRINHQNALTGVAQDYERVSYCSNPATAAGACEVPPNNPPMAVGSIADQTVTAGESVSVHFDQNFSDADADDTLTFSAMSSDASVATAYAHGDHVDITGVASGSAAITVTATDMEGASATQTFMVTVVAAELTAPANVTATVDDSDPGAPNVTVTWGAADNADRYIAVLFDSNFEFDPDHVATHQTDGSVTFMNVPAGTYIAAVISIEDDANGNAADIDFAVASVTVN